MACVLSPEMTEGPYYLPNEKVRRNITEGLPGAPLSLRLMVADASTCKPIKGAAVDIWHASAGGKYSGEQANDTVGQTFLRGIQRTDANGLALFTTVYPGWYPGRAVHIHVKVHVGGNVVHTGQLFFRDSFTDVVYRRAPYSGRRPATCATPTTRSTAGAAAARCSACAAPARATSARSRWACAAAELRRLAWSPAELSGKTKAEVSRTRRCDIGSELPTTHATRETTQGRCPAVVNALQ